MILHGTRSVEVYAAFEYKIPIVLKGVTAQVHGDTLHVTSSSTADMLAELCKLVDIETAACAVPADKLREFAIIGKQNIPLLSKAVIKAMASGQVSSLFSSTMTDAWLCGEPEAFWNESNEYKRVNELEAFAISGNIKAVAEIIASSNHYLDLTEALRGASRTDKGEIVSFILALGTNLDATGSRESRDSALAYAAFDSNIEIVKALVKGGANIHGRDRNGNTILQSLVRRKNYSLASYFISIGANVNDANYVSSSRLIITCLLDSTSDSSAANQS